MDNEIKCDVVECLVNDHGVCKCKSHNEGRCECRLSDPEEGENDGGN